MRVRSIARSIGGSWRIAESVERGAWSNKSYSKLLAPRFLRRRNHFGDRWQFFGGCRVDRERHRHAPAAIRTSRHVPMRQDDDRLVHELEPTFRLTDRFHRVGPDVRGPIGPQVDADAQPLIDEAERIDIAQIQPRAQLAERMAVGIAEVA